MVELVRPPVMRMMRRRAVVQYHRGAVPSGDDVERRGGNRPGYMHSAKISPRLCPRRRRRF